MKNKLRIIVVEDSGFHKQAINFLESKTTGVSRLYEFPENSRHPKEMKNIALVMLKNNCEIKNFIF